MRPQPTGILKVILFCLFFSHIGPIHARGHNQVRDLQLLQEEERVRLVWLMAVRPEVHLACRGWRGLDISFPDTEVSKSLHPKLNLDESLLTMSEDSPSSGITFHLKSKKVIREVDQSWLPDKKLFFIDIYTSQLPAGDEHRPPLDNRLKDIRFGLKERATRMVLGFDRKPDWELTEKAGAGIVLAFGPGIEMAGERKYGPLNRIESVLVEPRKQGLKISMKPIQPLPQVRVFWLEEGRRLVMDLLDQAAGIDEALLSFHGVESPRTNLNNKLKKENGLSETDAIAKGEMGQEGQANHLEKAGLNGSPRQTATGETPLSEEESIRPNGESRPGHIVRLRIPSSGILDPYSQAEEDIKTQAGITALSLVADPRLDNPLGEDQIDDRFQANLSPKEAFLYGRIEEAREIHDFERGISLINHFLLEFPDSVIREKLVFWQGDLFYRLWLQGRTDAAEKAIIALEQALDQYRNSPYAAPAMIKISQVLSSLGNHYKTIGLMSMLIQKKTPAYTPLAYLTRGKTYFKVDQPEKAVEDLQTLLREFPDAPYVSEAQFWIANYLHLKGVYDQAEARLAEIEKIDPEIYYDYPEYLFLRAQNLVYLKQYDQARKYFYKGLNLGRQPESTDLLLSRIGDTYHWQSREKEAESIYRLVVDYYPKSEGAVIARLRLADYTSDMELLEEISQERLDEPLTDLAILEKAYRLYEKEQLTHVLATLRDMIQKPVETQARQEARQLFTRAAEKEITRLFQTRQYEALQEIYRRERLLLSERINPETLNLVAQAYYHLGEYQDAISTFLEVKSYDLGIEARGKYLRDLADAFLKEGLDNRALEHLEKHQGDRLKAEDSQKLVMMQAEIYYKQGRILEAFEKYQRVIKGKPVLDDGRIAEAYLYSGKISNKNGNPIQAAAYLNRCIALLEKDGRQTKNLSLACIALGESYYARRQFKKAIDYYQQGLDLGFEQEDDPDYWNVRYRLAMSYLEAGEGGRAEPHFQEISEEADPLLQQRVQVKLGMLGLERQLNRLSIRSEARD